MGIVYFQEVIDWVMGFWQWNFYVVIYVFGGQVFGSFIVNVFVRIGEYYFFIVDAGGGVNVNEVVGIFNDIFFVFYYYYGVVQVV